MAPYSQSKHRPGLPEGYQYPTPKDSREWVFDVEMKHGARISAGQVVQIDGEIYTVSKVEEVKPKRRRKSRAGAIEGTTERAKS